MHPNTTASDKEIIKLLKQKNIIIPDPEILKHKELWRKIVQPSSLDLRTGNKAWRMKGSMRPQEEQDVLELVEQYALEELDLTQGARLIRDEVYLVTLQESINAKQGSFHANAKSSSGRNDLQVRLIADRNIYYDFVNNPGKRKLYNEITPHSFHSFLKTGTALNQLRYALGDYVMSDDEIRTITAIRPLVYDKLGNPLASERINHGIVLTADLNAAHSGSDIIGYRAKKSGTPVLDLQNIKGHSVHDFFDVILASSKEITLEPGYFYLLSTNEALSFPPTIAGRLKEFDHRVGNFTSHYAGFFDPGFGYFSGEERQGNTVTLEVRVHNNPEIIRDGQPIAVMQLERMSGAPLAIYGEDTSSNYTHRTGVRFGKHFRE